MAKLGGTKHLKRIAVPKSVFLNDRKEKTFLAKSMPGPHSQKLSLSLGVLLRDILKIASTGREIKRVLDDRMVTVDGRIITDFDFPVGIMDVVKLAKLNKTYRILVDSKARFFPKEVSESDGQKKLAKVVKKYVANGKLAITTHDGHTMLANNDVHVGDTLSLSLPDYKIAHLLKLENGVRCMVTEGKHAGNIATLKEIIKRKDGKHAEALLSGKDGDFITVAQYLFVVDKEFAV